MAYAEEGMAQALKNPFGQPMARPKKAAQTAAAIQRAWKMRQAGRAVNGASKLTKVGNTLSKIAKVATLGGGPVGTLASIAAWTIVPKILEGLISGGGEQPPMEQPLQTSQDPATAMLGGGDMGGQPAYRSSDMSDLIAENNSVRRMRELGTTSNNLTRSLQNQSASPELRNLIGVDEARVRSLQTPRTLSPYEVMNLIG
tara:strand:- start:68 stop:667 length:600 start_codon:yes stop_codon:yes gene_type:complete